MGGSGKKPKAPAKVPTPVRPASPTMIRRSGQQGGLARVGQGVATGPLGVLGGGNLIGKSLLGE